MTISGIHEAAIKLDDEPGEDRASARRCDSELKTGIDRVDEARKRERERIS